MPQYTRPWKRSAPVQPPGLRPLNDGCTSWRTQGPAAQVLAMPAKAAKPLPVLESNRKPLRDLNELLEKYGELGVQRELNVHRTTIRRWLAGQVQIPGHQLQVIRMLLGHLPGTDGKWQGWSFLKGQLVAPNGAAYQAGDVMAIGLERQRLRALENDLHQMRIRLAIAEEAERRHSGAANDSRAVG